MNHEHNNQDARPHCVPSEKSPLMSKDQREKILSFLGVFGCASCYVAMFPAILFGAIGILGLSPSQAASALNAYMGSVFFQPILAISILLLIAGIFRYGKLPLWLSILGGIGIFVSMNFYMRERLFTLSFAFVALAYFFALRQTKSPQFKFAFILLLAVVLFGVLDISRSLATKKSSASQAQPQPTNGNSMNTMDRR